MLNKVKIVYQKIMLTTKYCEAIITELHYSEASKSYIVHAEKIYY